MQEVREEEVLKQFMELMAKQNMGDQSKDFSDMMQYIVGIQMQLGVMIGELRDIKEQLAQMNGTQSKQAAETVVDITDMNELNEITNLEGKLSGLSGHLSELKNHLVETAKKAVDAFMEKGRAGMEKVFRKRMAVAKKTLTNCRKEMQAIAADCSRTADTVDRIGNELKQAKNSAANAGRILFGKEAKEASAEVQGVAFTRMVNAPVKGILKFAEENIRRIDQTLEKIERRENSAQKDEKETTGRTDQIEQKDEKKPEKASLIDKLHQKQEQVSSEQKEDFKEKTRNAPDKAEGR